MSSKDRIAVVTGGMGGIGTAICQQLKAEGAKVVAITHKSDMDEIAAWQQDNDLTDVDVVAADLVDVEASAAVMKGIIEKQGRVDILVNCAGITRDTTFKKMDADKWNAVIDTNLNSVYNVTQPVWNQMLENGFGRVINISSVNGQRGQFGQANYSAAKAGMHGFSMALAYEGATKGVTVNTLSPGYVETAMTSAIREDVLAAIIGGIPMRRMAKPEEIASAVAFLAADESTYITGVNLPVNGGLFIH
ncbi:MAG: acetoacetyl-CoA reductase [Gammaproteobacteria bacterium]|nr:acetoacetyl-CoA reductase [Gammaproteobacteria bacterium]